MNVFLERQYWLQSQCLCVFSVFFPDRIQVEEVVCKQDQVNQTDSGDVFGRRFLTVFLTPVFHQSWAAQRCQ